MQQALRTIDTKYAMYTRARRTASSVAASKNGGLFTPEQLLAASKVEDTAKKTATSQGQAVLQNEALTGVQLNIGGGNNAVKEIFQQIPSVPANLLINEPMRRVLTSKELEALAKRGGAIGGATE